MLLTLTSDSGGHCTPIFQMHEGPYMDGAKLGAARMRLEAGGRRSCRRSFSSTSPSMF